MTKSLIIAVDHNSWRGAITLTSKKSYEISMKIWKCHTLGEEIPSKNRKSCRLYLGSEPISCIRMLYLRFHLEIWAIIYKMSWFLVSIYCSHPEMWPQTCAPNLGQDFSYHDNRNTAKVYYSLHTHNKCKCVWCLCVCICVSFIICAPVKRTSHWQNR